MVRRAYAQRSVFEVLLPDGDKLWNDEPRAIDEILDDDELIDLVDAALRRRHPLSGRRGRLGTPATVVLRVLLLKHLRDWSFDECEREVRGSLVYRAGGAALRLADEIPPAGCAQPLQVVFARHAAVHDPDPLGQAVVSIASTISSTVATSARLPAKTS